MDMTTNVGSTDRMIRYGVAVAALIGAYLAGFGTCLLYTSRCV